MVLLALLVLFVVLPIVELTVLVRVAGEIGVLETIVVLVLLGAAGWWLCKQQGLGVLRRIQAGLNRGEAPSRELADGALIAFAGLLLVLPGFVSDIAALLLLFPPTRALVRGALSRSVRRSRVVTVTAAGGRTRVVTGRPVDVRSRDTGPGSSGTPPELGGG